MTIKILILILALLPVFSACERTDPVVKTQTPKPTVSKTATPDVSPTAAKAAEAKYYDGNGTVTKINMEIGSVELDHEEIKGLMPRMIMEFYVSQPRQLENLKVGDRVSFVLEDKAGAETITEIKKQ